MTSPDEKTPLYSEPSTLETQSSQQYRSLRGRLVHRRVPALLILVAVWFSFRAAFVYRHHYCPHKGLEEEETKLVPLEAHIMSKCPDAKDCLQQLVLPTMANVSDKINFTLSYIGSLDPKSDEVHCMHGPEECLGNIIQLCAADVYPDPKMYLGFTNCMTSDYKDIPQRDLVEECAMEYGIDFGKLNSCISDEGKGIDLLRASVERSRTLGVTKSCTIRLADEVRCIRDGGKWYDCEGGSEVKDLVADIESLYKKYN
jgi:hypothetical protein